MRDRPGLFGNLLNQVQRFLVKERSFWRIDRNHHVFGGQKSLVDILSKLGGLVIFGKKIIDIRTEGQIRNSQDAKNK